MYTAYCSVPQCSSWAKRNPELYFHHFPEAGKSKVYVETKMRQRELVDRRKIWVRNLKIGKPVTKYMSVCSLHFLSEDYVSTCKRILKKNAVPTVNLPLHDETSAVAGPSKRSERANKRFEMKENDVPVCVHLKEDEQASARNIDATVFILLHK